MSYMSTSENVGFSGIPQTLSEASCATQYKMAVEGVTGNSNNVNMFSHDSSGDEHTYITHLNDNYFHTKFKIDPNELYTFQDSDVIAGEITVSHTEDNYDLTETVDVKSKLEIKETDIVGSLANGVPEIKKEKVSNGHYQGAKPKPTTKQINRHSVATVKEKTLNAKVQKDKSQCQGLKDRPSSEVRRPSVNSLKGGLVIAQPTKISITSTNPTNLLTKISTSKPSTSTTATSSVITERQTFLDVFKKEQGVVDSAVVLKTESVSIPPLGKVQTPVTKKTASSASKTPNLKARKGRGPALHEALQRISKRAIPVKEKEWHAPGYDLFQCGPLDSKRAPPFTQDSSDDDYDMPDFETAFGPVCVEEIAATNRGARLALRRAAMRRHVLRAHTELSLSSDHKAQRALAMMVRKQISGPGPSRLPIQTVNYLLATRGMTSLLTSQERRRLREIGWSGGESGSTPIGCCAEENCVAPPLPLSQYCVGHGTRQPGQRLWGGCGAVFAGGGRCSRALLPLAGSLCDEHVRKRDNYDRLAQSAKDNKPRKPVLVRRACPPPQRAPSRHKKRRRPPAKAQEIKICSNSSTYVSSEDAALGNHCGNEFIPVASNELEVEVGQVPADDILDPSVLSQIPDEAFTEFFNQAEGGGTFAESSELAAALEAVLDERALDSIADVFTPHQNIKVQQVSASVSLPSAPS